MYGIFLLTLFYIKRSKTWLLTSVLLLLFHLAQVLAMEKYSAT